MLNQLFTRFSPAVGFRMPAVVKILAGVVVMAGLAAHVQAGPIFGICMSDSASSTFPSATSSATYVTNASTVAALAGSGCNTPGLTSNLGTGGAVTMLPSGAPGLTAGTLLVTQGASSQTSASLNTASLHLDANTEGTLFGCGGTCMSTGLFANSYAALLDTFTFAFSDGATSAVVGISGHLDGTIGNQVGATGWNYQYEEDLQVGNGSACFGTMGGPGSATFGPCSTHNFGFNGVFTNVSATGFNFSGTFTVTPGEVTEFLAVLSGTCQSGAKCDFSNTATFALTLPSNVTMTSASGVFGTANQGTVPEPASYVLMGLGLLSITGIARRLRR